MIVSHSPRRVSLAQRLLILCGALWVADFAAAQSISFTPANGNALTPMTVTVTGFIGSNGPVGVDVAGDGFFGSCNTARPCTFAANMGYFTGKYWAVASAMVDGVNVVVSNSWTVRDAAAYLNRACGTNGTQVLVTGYDFARNSTVYADSSQTVADVDGRFAMFVPIPESQTGSYPIVIHDGTRFVTNFFQISPNAPVCDEEIGHVRELTGRPTVQRPNSPPVPLRPGDPIHAGDVIRTGAGGRAEVYFADHTTLTLSGNSRVQMDNYVFNPTATDNNRAGYSGLEGAFKYTSGVIAKKQNPDVSVDTTYGHIGVRGTEFVSRRDPCSTTQEVYLIHGQLAIRPTFASTTNIVDAPATIFYDATNVWTSGLTPEAYEAMAALVNQTNPVTFASWQEQYFGCTNNNLAALASADPDGDGQNNYAEFLARTDPTTNASVFKLLNATREGDAVRVHWQTHGGVTNIVQATANAAGTYTNLSTALPIPGDTDLVTNYLDAGALTNHATRFYRIKLEP